MSHLDDRIAEFVFGEMPALEASKAAEHLNQCSECSLQVAEFRRTYSILQASPDVDMPRPVVIEVEKVPATPWMRRWLPPLASAVAASILTAVLMAPPSQPTLTTGPADYESVVAQIENLRVDLEVLEKKRLLDYKVMLETQGFGQQLAPRDASQD